MKTAENIEREKRAGNFGVFIFRSLQLMTDEWQTQGVKVSRVPTSIHHRNWSYFEGDQILIYYIAGSSPFLLGGGVCRGGERVQSLGTPLSQIPRVQI